MAVRDREAGPHGPGWLLQAARIAQRFYIDGASKTEIAGEVGLSRFKVASILEEALAMGVVQVTVRLPADIDPDLSAQLAQRYQPARALVVTCAGDAASTRDAVSRAAADLLSEVVSEQDVLGLTCSQSVALATQALSRLDPCPVVQLCGTLAGPGMATGSVESVRRAAHVGGGKAFPIYAPMLLPDPETARALRDQTTIRAVVDEFEAVNVALVAVGGWEAGVSTIWDNIEPAERRELSSAGAVGEIAGRVFDAAGSAVPSRLDGRVLGIDLDQLRRIPQVIGIGHEVRRGPAVRAALVGGLVDLLVCDDRLARELLTDQPTPAGRETRVTGPAPDGRPASGALMTVDRDAAGRRQDVGAPAGREGDPCG